MGDRTKIQWADASWSPNRGCSRISPGCGQGSAGGCYAEKIAARFSGPGQAFQGFATRASGGRWTRKVSLLGEDQLDAPLRWKKPRRIFVNSMSDTFHESLSNEQIAVVFGVMLAARRHTFLVLTKRAERMAAWFKWLEEERPLPSFHGYEDQPLARRALAWLAWQAGAPLPDFGNVAGWEIASCGAWPLINVHLGVSVESQPYVERIAHLLRTPAASYFVSAEPLLEGIDIARFLSFGGVCECRPEDLANDRCRCDIVRCNAGTRRVRQVIIGGESGANARPFHVEWAYDLIKQCRAANVSPFVKQLGRVPIWNGCSGPGQHWPTGTKMTDGWSPKEGGWRIQLEDKHGGDMEEWPASLKVREFPR